LTPAQTGGQGNYARARGERDSAVGRSAAAAEALDAFGAAVADHDIGLIEAPR
jgi:hypothetical protein